MTTKEQLERRLSRFNHLYTVEKQEISKNTQRVSIFDTAKNTLFRGIVGLTGVFGVHETIAVEVGDSIETILQNTFKNAEEDDLIDLMEVILDK